VKVASPSMSGVQNSMASGSSLGVTEALRESIESTECIQKPINSTHGCMRTSLENTFLDVISWEIKKEQKGCYENVVEVRLFRKCRLKCG
jgi:hypothetical protein